MGGGARGVLGASHLQGGCLSESEHLVGQRHLPQHTPTAFLTVDSIFWGGRGVVVVSRGMRHLSSLTRDRTPPSCLLQWKRRVLTVGPPGKTLEYRQWEATPVLLPGKSNGRRSLVGFSPWGRKESDTIKRLHFHFSLSCIGGGNGNPLQCSCLENPRDGGLASLVAQLVKNPLAMWETWVRALGWEDPLEKEMATHSSTLAWKIPWMEEPGRLQSMGSLGVGHN